MRITSSLPTHIARAYGVKPAAAGRPVQPAAPAARPAPADRVDLHQRDAANPNAKVRSLIAGRVSGSVSFDGDAVARTAARNAAIPMYTRAADRIEAAVGVQRGAQVDTRA